MRVSLTAPLAAHAGRRPDAVALSFETDRITWAELDQAVGRLAAHLAAVVPDGGGVALDLPNCPALALLFLAAVHAGREVQVLDPAWPAPTTRAVLDRLAPALVATADPSRAADRPALAVDPGAAFATVADLAGAPAGRAAPAALGASRPFYVGFTSGSTGLPKGIRRSQQSWLDSFAGDAREFGIGPDDVLLAPGTLAHSLFLYAMARGVHGGARVALSRRFNPSALVRRIAAEGVTVIYGVPTQLGVLIGAALAAPSPRLDRVRMVLSSGAKWSAAERPRLRQAFPNAAFHEFYGSSELSFVTVAKEDEAPPPGSVGRAFPGVSITIRDRDGAPLPVGEVGLVYVESPLSFLGYAVGDDAGWVAPDGSRSVGDLGVLDARGFLHLVGRASRLIIAAGKNVYPEEVEAVLATHPALAAVAVIGVADARRGERLVALVQPRVGAEVRAGELIAHARDRLSLDKVPRTYATVREWPLTPSGKTDLRTLGRLWDAGAIQILP